MHEETNVTVKHVICALGTNLGLILLTVSPLLAEESAGPEYKLNYDYLAAAYGISLGLLFGYLIWIVIKGKRLLRDREELKARGFQLEDEL